MSLRLSQLLASGCVVSSARRRPSFPLRLLCSGNAAASPTPPPWRLPKVYEPEYLDVKPDYPAMAQFQLSLTAYDFHVLERFSKYAHNLLRHQFGLREDQQCDLIAWPLRKTSVDLYQAESTKVRDTFQLNTYRRVVTVDGLRAVEVGLLLNVLSQNLPEGVTMSMQRPSEEDTEFRYVPDLEIQELKKQAELGKGGKL